MRDPLHDLHAAPLPVAAFLQQPVACNDSVLGALCFSADAAGSAAADAGFPALPVCMPRLDGTQSTCEVWRGHGNVIQGRHGAIRYRHDGAALFGVIALAESEFHGSAGKSPLQQAAESAYRDIFAALDPLGFPHLYRFWNFLPEINAHSHGLERYRQFNLGRQQAFAASHHHGRDAIASLPAACALGSSGGPLSIAFLAGRVVPQHIENPRQVSAYHYPPQYGPRTPLFSRATLVQVPHQALLLISGTASVVGHATAHAGDVAAQARETVANIRSVLAEANRIAGAARFELHDLACRVYVRRPADLPQIRAALAQCAGDALNAVYLQADICRATS